jgi:hypothetical protein
MPQASPATAHDRVKEGGNGGSSVVEDGRVAMLQDPTTHESHCLLRVLVA